MVNILLVRHLESIKNVDKIFSSTFASDPLTSNGIADGEKLADSLAKFSSDRNLKANCIYTSNAQRALATANIISQRMGITCKGYDELLSFNMGGYSGEKEDDLIKKDPNLHEQLDLYRVGLFNSYNLSLPSAAEMPLMFEKRVNDKVRDIISIPGESLKIIILHRSPLTAILIDFARRYYRYPTDYYGFIKLDIGFISWLTMEDDKIGKINKVNVSPNEILVD